MSELNLEVKLIATPWLSPSLLNNYYTKEEVGDLKDYVKEVENPEVDTIYGRQKVNDKMEWVPVLKTNGLVCYGASAVNPITTAQVNTFAQEWYKKEYSNAEVEVTSTESSYIWFCTPDEITSVEYISGMTYEQPITKQEGKVVLTLSSGNVLYLNCYYTPKLIAGTYKFKVFLKEGD